MDKHKNFGDMLEFKLKKLGNKTWLASFINGNYTEYYSALPKEEETSYDQKGAVIYVVSVLFFFGISIILMIASSIRKKNKHDHAVSKYMKGMDRVRRIEKRHAKFKTRIAIMGNKEVSQMARRNSDKPGESKLVLHRKKEKLMKWKNFVPDKHSSGVILLRNTENAVNSKESPDSIRDQKVARYNFKEEQGRSLCQSLSSTSLPSLRDIPDNRLLPFDSHIGSQYDYDSPQKSVCQPSSGRNRHNDEMCPADCSSVSVAIYDGDTTQIQQG